MESHTPLKGIELSQAVKLLVVPFGGIKYGYILY